MMQTDCVRKNGQENQCTGCQALPSCTRAMSSLVELVHLQMSRVTTPKGKGINQRGDHSVTLCQ